MFIKFIRYNLVQVVTYALEFSIFLGILAIWKDHLVIANCISKIVAAILAFILHKHFTFEITDKKRLAREILSYAALNLINIFLSSSILLILSNFLPEWLAKLLSDTMCMVSSFLLTHFVVFRSSKPQQ